MSDEEKLSRPSFEQMNAGVEVASNKVAVTENREDLLEVKAIEFETSLIGKNVVQPEAGGTQPPKRLYTLSVSLLEKQSRFGAAAKSQARRAGNWKVPDWDSKEQNGERGMERRCKIQWLEILQAAAGGGGS